MPPARDDMPSTLRRSPPEAQEVWSKAHDSAVGTYGEGERAHRTAFAALKHSFEKVGDHWEPKPEGRRGPSGTRAAQTADDGDVSPTAEGVDANASTRHLYDLARRLGIRGRSSMNKGELVEAIRAENRRRTAAARQR